MIIKREGLSDAELVRKILERDARNIYKAQRLIIGNRIYLSGKSLKAKRRTKGVKSKTGFLESTLSNPDFYIKSEGEQFNLVANYPLYIRFLDMKKRSNAGIYNRQIFGILYNNAMKDIKNNAEIEIRDYVAEALELANPSKK